jgi:hypothetical protein
MSSFGSFIYHSGVLYGAGSSISAVSPDTGPASGGNAFVLSGGGLNLTSWDDDFTAPALLGTLWTDISSGTGALTTGASHLTLSTGTTAGSVAGVESVPTVENFQFEVNVNIPRISSYPGSSVNFITISYYIDASNYTEMSVRVGSTSSAITLHCETVLGGVSTGSYDIVWTTGISTFKVLRWLNRVYFIANGTVIYVSTGFTPAVATYRIYAYNNAATYDVAGVVVNSFCSRPFAVFGDTPVFDTVTVSDNRARGIVPPSIDVFGTEAGYAGLITVYFVSASVSSLSDGYEYYFEKDLVLVSNQQDDIVLSIVDPIVRTPANVRRGL